MTTPQDELVKLQQELLAREVDAEVKNEQMRALWKKYRFVVGGAIAVVLMTVIGLEFYHSWQTKQQLLESDQFENAVILVAEGKNDEAQPILNNLIVNGKTGYQYLAMLKMAYIYGVSGDTNSAVNLLKQVFDNSSAPKPLADVARLTYVGAQIDSPNANPAELEKMLSPLQNPKNAFYGEAVELSAVLALNQGKTDEAATLLKAGLNAPKLNPAVRERLTELAAVVEGL